MRSLIHTLSALALIAALFATAQADSTGDGPSSAGTTTAAPAAPAAAESSANAADPSPPEEEAVPTASGSLLLAIITYGMRHARR